MKSHPLGSASEHSVLKDRSEFSTHLEVASVTQSWGEMLEASPSQGHAAALHRELEELKEREPRLVAISA